MSQPPAKSQHGFTLIEMMLTVGIMTLLIGLSLPVYESFVRRNDLEVTAEQLAGTLRRAEAYARAANYSNPWSVEIAGGMITLFQGTNFAGRNTAFDETIDMPDSITSTSGLSEVQFAEFTALPNATGTITLTSSASDTKVITINAKGMVSY